MKEAANAYLATMKERVFGEKPNPKRVNFVCVNVGPAYGMEYVAILRDMILRNVTQMEHECAFFCLTDRADELPEGVHPIAAPEGLPGWWAKVALFSPDMPWEVGDRCVYFDLDVTITGRLEEVVERKGIIQDWHWPCYNSSVMVWDHGEHRHVWDSFHPGIMTRPARPDLQPLLPAGQVNGGDQEWLSAVSYWPTFPAGWFVSYRDAKGWPPTGAKAVIFHGRPKPAEIAEGWVPNVWRAGGYTALPEMRGVNVSYDQIHTNVRSAVQRDLPWFSGFRDEGQRAVLVCGAPSMRDCLPEIRAHARDKRSRIISVNNAWRFLVENGITPHAHVMLDARPENSAFLDGAPKETRYLIASQCHPAVFDALADHPNVVVWHNGHGENETLREILDPWWGEGPNQKPCIIVPGGGTVGLRSLWLAAYSGFRTIHVYGMDSSFAETGEHHAYPQPLNDGDRVIDAAMGDKTYRCAPWMLRQAEEFRQHWSDLRAFRPDPSGPPQPVTIHVHGRGLIPDMARALRAEEGVAA